MVSKIKLLLKKRGINLLKLLINYVLIVDMDFGDINGLIKELVLREMNKWWMIYFFKENYIIIIS